MLQLHICQNLPMSWHIDEIPLSWCHGQLHSIFPTDILSSTPVIFYATHKIMLPLLAIAHTVHVNRTTTSYTTPPLSAGSSCTVRVTAVFGSNHSNGVSYSNKTASTGTTYHQCNSSVQHISVKSHYQYVLCISSPDPTGTPGGLNITSVESRSLSVM